jgi:hypothetical protein
MSGPGVQIKGSTVAAKKIVVLASMIEMMGRCVRNLVA